MELSPECKYNSCMTLKEFFELNPKIAVAFSGGVDSAFLLSEAVKSGADVRAYCVRSEFNPAFEFEDARKIADYLGADMVQITMSVLEDETVVSNPEDRCYHCKLHIMSRIKEAAADDGYGIISDGTNASDDADDRPGMKALKELGIISPLRLCGITKEEVREGARRVLSPLRECGLTKSKIRQLSKEAGLFTWNKASYACLATRIPHGERITESKLKGTEKAERILYDMGFRDFRVRWRGNDALVQVKQDQLEEAFERADEIRTALGRIYDWIEIDENPR